MKPKKILFLILAIICCIAADCGKDNDKPTYYMPQDFKDYVMYPVGSYWIYEDSVSGDIDSIYLIMNEIKIFEPPHSDFLYERLEGYYYSFYLNKEFWGGTQLDVSIFEFRTWPGYGYYFNNSNIGYSIQDGKYLKYYDSLEINGKYYYNVKCILKYSSNIQYFWSKNIGLIKKEIPDSINWLLKSYYINN